MDDLPSPPPPVEEEVEEEEEDQVSLADQIRATPERSLKKENKMTGDSIWIIGASMTKFARYEDQDSVDLASTASLEAMVDAGVSIHDMDVLAAGTLFQASTSMGQRIQKQIGQTGIPVYNVSNACATGATAIRTVYLSIKAGEADMPLQLL